MLVQPLASDDPAEIGGYRLRARLGAGGMGRVYLASTPAGRSVAVKVVRPELSDDQDFRARFRHEIQAARRVHGLYTAQLLDADATATPPWLVTGTRAGRGSQEITIVGALISIGVWLAMARRTRRGRPGVRVMSMIFFGLDCLTVAKTFAHGLVTGPVWIIGAAEWGVGLTVIVFLWDRRSSAYFAQQRQARSLATPQWRTAPGVRRPG